MQAMWAMDQVESYVRVYGWTQTATKDTSKVAKQNVTHRKVEIQIVGHRRRCPKGDGIELRGPRGSTGQGSEGCSGSTGRGAPILPGRIWYASSSSIRLPRPRMYFLKCHMGGELVQSKVM